ncbi:MAG: YkgJ family cysteine cluster protein [Firmicutes bacterium]|nr:YkgJ family cysteine cluster protein [Bacillota bacterium]
MSDQERLFAAYEKLAAGADLAFAKVQQEHGSCVKCEVACSDCCHAVFGVFPIEAAYLNRYFGALPEELREQARQGLALADRELREMQKKLEACGDDRDASNLVMAETRVRCPLLTAEEKCLLYDRRPITCRVYGMPTQAGGKTRACWKAGFVSGQAYPVFDLDAMYRELYRLSGDMLALAGEEDQEKAGLLVSVAQALK